MGYAVGRWPPAAQDEPAYTWCFVLINVNYQEKLYTMRLTSAAALARGLRIWIQWYLGQKGMLLC